MTQPQPTQSRHPWRATARTAVAVIGGVLSLLPYLSDIATTAQIDTVPAVAQMVAVSAIITRILAIPGVNDLLRRHRVTRVLAAEPAPQPRGLSVEHPPQPTLGPLSQRLQDRDRR